MDTPSELLPAKQKGASMHQWAIALRPGLYKVDMVVKDVNNPDHIGRWTAAINVPKFDDDTLGHSSLILADEMYRVPSKEIGTGSFVIGDTHVRPRVGSGGPQVLPKFSRGQSLNFWMQVYNLGIDEKSKQNNATIEYEITNLDTKAAVLDATESSAKSKPERRAVDAGEEHAAGGPAAGTVPGEHQGERWCDQTANGRDGKVLRKLILG